MSEPPQECDVVVVGAGIVGLAIARELVLRNDGLRVTVLEREDRIAAGQTGSSSGVIHAGIYYAPGSLKAAHCVEGARRLYAYCEEHSIEHRRDGKLIVATEESELAPLAELERRARTNGAEIERVDPDRIAELEPNAAGIAGLHSPNTGVVDFTAVAAQLAREFEAAGGQVATGCEVTGVRGDDRGIEVSHSGGRTAAKVLIGAAGAGAGRLAERAGCAPEPHIVGITGSYLEVPGASRDLVRASIYPVSDPGLPFLGAHLTRTIDGRLLLGPTAAPDGDRGGDTDALPAWGARLVPALAGVDLSPGPSGVRAQAANADGSYVEDFVIEQAERSVHVRNAPSPAATAALSLAEVVSERIAAGLSAV